MKPIEVGTRILVVTPVRFARMIDVLTGRAAGGHSLCGRQGVIRDICSCPTPHYDAEIEGERGVVTLERPEFIPLDDPDIAQEEEVEECLD